MYLQQWRDFDWVQVAHDRSQRRPSANMTTKLLGPYKTQNFFCSSQTISSSRRAPNNAVRLICVINGQQRAVPDNARVPYLLLPPGAHSRYNPQRRYQPAVSKTVTRTACSPSFLSTRTPSADIPFTFI
jgi:hypothetical protein